MQMTDRLSCPHCYTGAACSLVHFGNGAWLSCAAVMSRKDDLMMESAVDFSRDSSRRQKVPAELVICEWDPVEPMTEFLKIAAGAPRGIGRALIKVYRITLSPLIGMHCRHLPTCSDYADQAIERHGLWAGGWMTVARLTRCHPLGTSGLDLVPQTPPGRARWYLPWRYGSWSWRNRDETV
jgi:uncharacterized protein